MEELRTAGVITSDWYRITLYRLVDLSRSVASKYTRAKVRAALPEDFQYIIDELLHTSGEEHDKQAYYQNIISTVIEVGQAEAFIVALCNLIKRMAVDCLHVVGDIYDRGKHADRIMDMLREHHNVDIQWGNHDIVWMGAAAGSAACVATVLNSALQYNTLSTIENSYGISLRDLIGFAQETYKGCTWFMPRNPDDAYYVKNSMDTLSKAHKAIAIIMFKLEGQIIKRHPEYGMEHRLLLNKIDYENNTVTISGAVYPLNDGHFPTIDPADPYKLSVEESEVIERIAHSFTTSEKLQRHIRCLLDNGSMYLVYNGNLLFHASVPMNPDGTLKEVFLYDGVYKGRSLLDKVDTLIRAAHSTDSEPPLRDFAIDYLWYLWCGKDAPTFDKDRMATFERYFLKDKSIMKETKGSYYTLRNEDSTVDLLLKEFGVEGDHRHIINGHIPVKTLKGENPMKAGGRLIVIDGGFSKPYQSQTGIAGYTLVYHSRGMSLVEHQPFTSTEEAIRNGSDIKSTHHLVETSSERIYVRDTDKGRDIRRRIDSLRKLLFAYQNGMIRELR
jgi:fructose-1,6-bisphosphatase-3